jgi:uncharacterized protein (TIGR02147 family)
MSDKPSVYQYRHYVDFLREVYRGLASRNPAFSLRAFSRWLGYPRSHNYASLVMTGQRRLTYDSAMRICRNLNLSDEERDYLLFLLALNNQHNPLSQDALKKCLQYILKEHADTSPSEPSAES